MNVLKLISIISLLLLPRSGSAYGDDYPDYFDDTFDTGFNTDSPSVFPSSHPSPSPSEFPSKRPSPQPQPKCQVSSDGVYGDVTTDTLSFIAVKYDYQMTRNQGDEIVTRDVLNDLEKAISNSILASGKIFEECNEQEDRIRKLLQSSESLSLSLHDRALDESEFDKFVGLKSKPADVVVTSDSCSGSIDESVSLCVVVEGKLKIFYEGSMMDDELKKSDTEIQSVIEKGMKDGSLKDANSAITRLEYIPPDEPIINSSNGDDGVDNNPVEKTHTLNSANLSIILFAVCATLVFIVLGAIKYRVMKRKIIDDFENAEEIDESSVSSRSVDIFENDFGVSSQRTKNQEINRTYAMDDGSSQASFSTRQSYQTGPMHNHNHTSPYNRRFFPNVPDDETSVTTPMGVPGDKPWDEC